MSEELKGLAVQVVNSSGDTALGRRPRCVPPSENQLLISVSYAGICGTDLTLMEYGSTSFGGPFEPPVVLGHELVGEVVEIGTGISSDWIGKTVTANSIIHCGQCPECVRGMFDSCRASKLLGLTIDGCFATQVLLDVRQVVELPASVQRPELYVFSEPIGCAYKALSSVRSKLRGSSIGVWGLGPIGYFIGSLARTHGADTILGVEPIPERRKHAESAMLAGQKVYSEVVSPERASSSMNELDYAFDASWALRENLLPIMESLKCGGTLVVVGRPHDIGDANFNPLIDKQLSIVGSRGQVQENCTDRAVEYILEHSDTIPASTYRMFDMRDFEHARRTAIERTYLKVIVRP